MEGNILSLKERYEKFYSDEGIDSEQLDKIKRLLNVYLPPKLYRNCYVL